MFAAKSQLVSILRSQQAILPCSFRSFSAKAQTVKKEAPRTLPEFASKVLMVEPTHFFLNEETFADNKFMNKVSDDMHTSSQKAKDEFKRFMEQI